MTRTLTLLICVLFASQARAAESGVLFILDGSGSMWGQVDGRAKIDIAKELMTELIGELPSGAAAGLAAYGHRRKGDCDDIEMLTVMARDNRDALRQQIQALTPKGKTPITGALQLVGDSVRTVEDETILVLISDGKETCGSDPCALTRLMIEQGLKLRVHVVGFDVEQAEREQLMCIAKEGGGNYYNADSAGELGEALAEVRQAVVAQVEKAEPPPASETIFVAVDANGQPLAGAVEWTIIESATEDIQIIADQGSEIELKASPGKYEVFVTAGDASGEAVIEVAGGPAERFEVSVNVAKELPPFDAPASAAAGSRINFGWRGPNAKGDIIFIAPANQANNRYPTKFRFETAKGPTASLVVPARPGKYEIRYFGKASGGVLFRAPLTVTPAQVTFNAPETVPAGSRVSLSWTGPKAGGDKVFIAKTNLAGNRYFTKNVAEAKKDSAVLIAPAIPGAYEIRYYSGWHALLARTPLTVSEPEVTIDAPRTAERGTRITVQWSGPKVGGDILFVAERGMDDTRYYTSRNHAASKGSPASFAVPAKPGTYEIRYYSKANGRTLARRALIVR